MQKQVARRKRMQDSLAPKNNRRSNRGHRKQVYQIMRRMVDVDRKAL